MRKLLPVVSAYICLASGRHLAPTTSLAAGGRLSNRFQQLQQPPHNHHPEQLEVNHMTAPHHAWPVAEGDGDHGWLSGPHQLHQLDGVGTFLPPLHQVRLYMY